MKKNIIRSTILACTLAGVITLGGATSEAALGDKTLSPGMNHSDVMELQQGLRKLNFFTYASNTTYFGNITKQAVQKFQQANGLTVDGCFGPASARTLKSKLSGNTSPKPQASTGVTSGNSSSNGLLKQGSRGVAVGTLQQSLSKLGYYKGSIDSVFGAGTKSSVMNFQKSKCLSADGVVGAATTKSINQALSSGTTSGGNTATKVVNTAKRYVGHKYVFGGVGPSGFDCSGFTQYVYKQTGISIPRTTRSQSTVGKSLSKPQVSSGDLIVFSDTYQPGPSHVGICIGNGNFVHAANAKKGVRTDSLNSTYYKSKFTSGRRLF